MLLEPTTMSLATRALAATLHDEYELDPEPVFRQAGIDPDLQADPQLRYPLSQMRRLWQAAVEASGDPLVGLKTGWRVHPADFYAFGYSWLASSTLLDGMQRLCRYHRMLSTASVEISLRETAAHYALSAAFPDDSRSPPKEGCDAGMTALLKLCRIVAAKDVYPERVELTCGPDVHPEAYREHLGAPIEFGFDAGTFYFSKALLEETLPGGTPEVAKATDRISERYLETIDPHKIASQVRRLLIAMLPSGGADQDRVASRLHRSTSTLQRQLQAEGTSYRDVLDNTRRSLAEDYLRDGKMSHAQIAYLLGFSDQSNFSRAFKRWTDRSPREFQTGLTAAATRDISNTG